MPNLKGRWTQNVAIAELVCGLHDGRGIFPAGAILPIRNTQMAIVIGAERGKPGDFEGVEVGGMDGND